MKIAKVYIAAPYTSPDPAVNTAIAMAMWHHLRDLGFSPFCPHLSHFLHIHKARPYQEWLDYDNEWIEVCDVLLRLPGDSSGADDEITLALNLDIPVCYSVDSLLAWRKLNEQIPKSLPLG